jgi:hypothetical protein
MQYKDTNSLNAIKILNHLSRIAAGLAAGDTALPSLGMAQAMRGYSAFGRTIHSVTSPRIQTDNTRLVTLGAYALIADTTPCPLPAYCYPPMPFGPACRAAEPSI